MLEEEKKHFIELINRCYDFLSADLERFSKSDDQKNYDAYAFNHLYLALKKADQDLQIAFMESDDYKG